MDYNYKYIKYKTKYLQNKNNISGGYKDEKPDTGCGGYTFEDLICKKITLKEWNECWSQKYIKREKELENVSETDSYIKKTQLTSKNKIYYIHDNGGRPFKVMANSKEIIINTLDYNSSDDKNIQTEGCECDLDKYKYDYLMNIENFMGYWEGFDSSPTKMHGNSILVKITDNSYIFIGWEIYNFETDDIILEYISPVGNNDVPYPIAIGTNFVYIMTEKKMIEKTKLKKPVTIANSDGYSWELAVDSNNKKNIHNSSIPIKNINILQKRLM